ncbi:uncharacterized protein LOC127533053 isoform X1 [Acanthochromis polyacanthus]|uniref:uncharacterized protein LOC127533053 isoform X1 n=1 Tax=Acanthochromis polyacanthus TaxID=80966 RepID=UPI0022349EDF|nr:uncharacterized protein LOC127533053 isoform X1 [Acanthochromis polyacanthus]
MDGDLPFERTETILKRFTPSPLTGRPPASQLHPFPNEQEETWFPHRAAAATEAPFADPEETEAELFHHSCLTVMELLTRFILLLLVISLCDAEEEKKNLSGTKGGNITLPDPLLERGFLSYGENVIAQVIEGKLIIEKNIYKNRLQWNQTSGLFTLTDLQRNDSGIYKIESKEGEVSTISIYNLTVYDPVAPPAVQTLNVSSDSCYLLCAVDKAAEITLWWYKDQEVVDQSRSAGPLPLTVTKQDLRSSYRCVAGNPAENKTLLVDLQKVCGEKFSNSSSENNQRHGWIIGVSTGCAVLTVTVAAFLIWLTCFSTSERKDSLDSTTEVEYAGVNICADRHSQGGHFPDSPGSADRLLVYHVIDPDSEGHV